MPNPRVVRPHVWNDKIYLFGGTRGFSPPRGLNSADVYDPKTDTWSELAPMPRGGWGHGGTLVGDKIHFISGTPTSGSSTQNAELIHQVYDLKTDRWTNATPMPIAVRSYGASVLRGRIYVVGGWLNGGATPYSDTWVYDPILDTWKASAPCPERRAGHRLAMVSGKIYAIGGSPTGHNIQATATVWEFTPSRFDFNNDGIVDAQDMTIMVDHWHTDAPRYDLTPSPGGDGIVDVQDLIALSEHLFEDERTVAYWKLDETDGDVAYDSVGENDAVVIGDAMWQPDGGQVRGALQFNGIDGYLSAPFILDPSKQPYSVTIWIKGGQPGQTIISQQGAFGDWLYLDAAGTLTTSLIFPLPPVTSDVVVTDDHWHHVGLVVHGSGMTLYLDDAEVARTDTTPFFSAKGDLQIGAGNNLAPGTFWSGMIDDVRIYDRAVAP